VGVAIGYSLSPWADYFGLLTGRLGP